MLSLSRCNPIAHPNVFSINEHLKEMSASKQEGERGKDGKGLKIWEERKENVFTCNSINYGSNISYSHCVRT